MASVGRRLRAGDWVEVRSKEEILSTLDEAGRLDGMPFMPEMFVYCGRRFRVYKRAHKTCDTVFPVRGRKLDRAVHLDTRCDGSAHGGCQAACLIFWKEAWLLPVGTRGKSAALKQRAAGEPSARAQCPVGCEESTVRARTQTSGSDPQAPTYLCQATQLPYATTDLAWWDLRQYWEDYWSGNVGIQRMLGGLVYSMCYNLSQAGIGLGRPMRWVYDKLYSLRRGTVFPRTTGRIPNEQPTPEVSLDLQPGEAVRVKSHREILRTLNESSKNRGLYWDAEMVPYCGKTYRVLSRVTRIIDEKSGKMQEMKNACIILDSVICQARYSGCRMFCPRSIYPYWREIWLERVPQPACDTTGPGSGSASP